jgi:ribosomal protein L22
VHNGYTNFPGAIYISIIFSKLIRSMQNIRKTTFVLHKLSMAKAKRYLEDIIAHRQSIVFRRYCGVVGRTAQP